MATEMARQIGCIGDTPAELVVFVDAGPVVRDVVGLAVVLEPLAHVWLDGPAGHRIVRPPGEVPTPVDLVLDLAREAPGAHDRGRVAEALRTLRLSDLSLFKTDFSAD